MNECLNGSLNEWMPGLMNEIHVIDADRVSQIFSISDCFVGESSSVSVGNDSDRERGSLRLRETARDVSQDQHGGFKRKDARSALRDVQVKLFGS